ncbi:hypothetical protein OOZ63_25915 [Paucibacter sp. PLA-PC-4]|uniref:hypothetical protein n=1 Tax=Paucibacter sp. PLA-PC-4 TaxID=2993655 RepID=UPI00224B2ACE|nr:hypothetical protein [Paucibacter sp. PLA-PC-4]MCX2865269.1 hypothetical protein [Paucibacter sp. PLA-PC-4]
MTKTLYRTLSATALILFTGLAQAQAQPEGLTRVEVSGKQGEPVRRDVSRSCPGVAATMQDVLEKAWYLEGQEATVRVTFRLQGEETTDVSSKGGPLAYRMAVRRAVIAMQCTKQATDGQLFSFDVSFVAPKEDDDASYRVALQEN